MLAASESVVERDAVGAGAGAEEPAVGRRATSVPELELAATAAVLAGVLDAAVVACAVADAEAVAVHVVAAHADAADADAVAEGVAWPPLVCTGGGGGGTLGGRAPAVEVEGGRKKWKSDGVISRELLALDVGVSGGGGHAGSDGGVLESTRSADALAGERTAAAPFPFEVAVPSCDCDWVISVNGIVEEPGGGALAMFSMYLKKLCRKVSSV